MTYWLNGDFKQATAAIDIADRGFLLSDGLFETLLVMDGVPVFLDRHLRRMADGLTALDLSAPLHRGEIANVIKELAVRNNASAGSASARITVTRGGGARGLAYDKSAAPTRLITLTPYAPPSAKSPAALMVSRHRRNEQSFSARWKTLAYLDNSLARNEAAAAGADDAVMLNTKGRVACASAANIFAISGGAVKTPPISEGALPGIVRAELLCCARREGIPVSVAPIELEALRGAATFLTNSLIGLRPAQFGAAFGGEAEKILQLLQSCYANAVTQSLKKQKPL